MAPRRIRFNGKTFVVRGMRWVNRRKYLLLERLTGPDSEKFLAFLPEACPGGDLRMIHFVRHSRESVQFLGVLQRLIEDNRNFPKILEYEVSGNTIALVSTWIRGESLAYRLERAQRKPQFWPSPLIAFRLYRGLAHALHHLSQQQNLVHGDIKPGNLIVAPGPLRLVVTDFGSAWTVERTVKRLKGDGRSDFFASPEQMRDEREIDFRSDLFSATTVFYQMLTRELPYGGLGGKVGLPQYRKTFELLLNPPSAKCKDRSKMPAEFWRLVDEAVMCGLAVDAKNRFDSTHSWIELLNEIDARLKIAAPPGLLARSVLRVASWFSATREIQD